MFTNNSRRNTQSFVKSCKFCKDAGKSEEEYMSHFLRESKDPESRITCPTLLAIECRFCFKRGHTVSKCAKLAKQKNGRNLQNAPVKKAWSENTRPVAVNPFDLLSEFGDSDNEEGDSIGETVETVTTCQDCDTVSTPGSFTYAEMLAKPAPIAASMEVGSRLSILTKARLMCSWADSDSDDE